MAGSVNKAIIIGNAARDPEIRTMQNSQKVASFSLATNESWKDKATGERKEKAEFHRIVVFGALAEIVERYVKKGSKVYVSGQIQTRKWIDKDGADKYTTEIVLQGFNSELTLLDGPKRDDGVNQDQGGWDA